MKALLFLLVAQSLLAQDAVVGAGATFPAPLYQKWIAAFEAKTPGPAIRYEATGSTDGLARFKRGELDFAASDIPPQADMPSGAQVFPSIVGAVVPVYNIPGLKQDLRFSPQVLAGIYLGKILKWNDVAIKALNRGISLPDAEIKVVHRSDGSGTTFVFSEFLSKTDSNWKAGVGVGSTLNWPIGDGAAGNDGVAAKVAAATFSIGYVEFIYAVKAHLSFGSVRNSSGNFVRAGFDSLTAAAKTVGTPNDFKISITNAPGNDSYSIASFTWLVISPKAPKRLMSFLEWALSAGQRQAAALGYVPLPEDLAQRELTVLMAR